MTDDRQQPDERAERAFRDALTQRADTLEPASISTRGRRGRRWPLLVAGAAAAAVLAVVATYSVINADDDIGGPDPGAATATTADATDAPTPTDEPATGLRTVGYRDLEIDVPEEWASIPTPNPNGCDYPETPFVATYDPTQAFTLQLCGTDEKLRPPEGFPTAKLTEWSPNVQLSPTSAAAESLADGSESYRGWTLTRNTVGAVRIEILTDASTESLVDPILASARTVETDINGCDATSSAQSNEFVRPPAFDLAGIEAVTSISVCQYTRGDTTTPGLTASTMLTGDDAQAELEAIQGAPAGGGPDNPQNCLPDLYGDSALVLRLGDQDSTVGDVYVYYDWCFGNGFDDGTTRRAITADNCPPLFSGAVQQYSGDGSTFALCHP